MCAEALCSSLWGAVAVSILVLGITVALTSLAKSRGQGSGQVVTGAEVTSAPQLPSAEQTAAIIRRRRSIFPKDMNGQMVSQEEVTQLLEAANWAPTHGKTEPWRFAVLASREAQLKAFEVVLELGEELLAPGSKELEKLRQKTRNWTGSLLPKLSHMIVLGCRRAPNTTGKLMPEWEDMAAVATAVQNLHIMATALGLAGYWSSWPTEEVRRSQRFKASLGWQPGDDTICMGCFFLGRSDAADSYRAKRGAVADKVLWHT